jgi:hypothetical protein
MTLIIIISYVLFWQCVQGLKKNMMDKILSIQDFYNLRNNVRIFSRLLKQNCYPLLTAQIRLFECVAFETKCCLLCRFEKIVFLRNRDSAWLV